MNIKQNKKTHIILLFIIIIMVFIKWNDLNNIFIYSSINFINKAFFPLFVSIIINSLFIKFNIPMYIYKYTKNINLYLLIISLLSGSPSSTYVLKEFLDQKYITENEASKILSYAIINSPFYIYNFVLLITKRINSMIIIYLIYIIIFLIMNKKNNKIIKFNKVSKSTISIINEAIYKILNIYSIYIIFSCISLLIKNNNTLFIFLKGLIENTSIIDSLLNVRLSNIKKELLIIAILTFTSFSIWIQVINVLDNYKINYKYMIITKTLIVLIIMLIYLLF